MLKGIYVLDSNSFNLIYGEEERKKISEKVEIYAPPQTAKSIRGNLELLKPADLIFSGWGGPKMDEEFLNAAPNLKAVFYGAGSIKPIVTDAFWDKGILITSAYSANGISVAEYTLSQILFCLKRGWYFALSIKKNGRYPSSRSYVPGTYNTIVGIVSLGMIGKHVCRLLQSFDVQVIAYDPFIDEKTASELNVKLCSLDEVFKSSDVVSIHTPWLKETENMIREEHFASMKKYATFINTARGAIVHEKGMIKVLTERPDLQAVLDVTYPEPPELNSPLYTLPNVVLTPHIAGSMCSECERMGRYMTDELERYINGEALRWQISREKAKILA